MDAMEFIKEFRRFCEDMTTGLGCHKCPCYIGAVCDGAGRIDVNLIDEKFIDGIDALAKESPIKTRQSEFLKMFPNVKMDEDGIIDICPDKVDSSIDCEMGLAMYCNRCRQDYWLEEVE